MSLTVQHLNDDSTFLLTFSPSFAPASHARGFPGSFTIVVDPWLSGASSIFHPAFQLSRHATTPLIKSLADIDGIDLVLVTQDKPDHCHKQTLCSLPKDASVCIVATPAAARRIRKWNYFANPDIIRTMQEFNPKQRGSIVRIPIAAHSSTSAEGEITIANISPRWDLTGVHNAVGITYRPPGTLLRAASTGSFLSLRDMPMMSQLSRYSSQNDPSPLSTCGDATAECDPYLLPPLTPDVDLYGPESYYNPISSSPLPMTPSTSGSTCPPAVPYVSTRQENFETVLSVIYTPHGVPPTVLRPYIRSHLAGLHGALPLTVLFHSLTLESNPWFLGGDVCRGAPGAVEILKKTNARYWIGAHDEPKENNGLAVTWLKTRRFEVEEVREMMGEERETELHVLGCGEERRFVGKGGFEV